MKDVLLAFVGMAWIWVPLLGYTLSWYDDHRAASRARALTKVTAASPPSLDRRERVLDPESFWDSALYSLSPELRDEFDTRLENISLTKSEPVGSLTVAAVAATYREAVLRGTASVEDYREIQRALEGSLSQCRPLQGPIE